MKKSILTVMIVSMSLLTIGNMSNFKILMKKPLTIVRTNDESTNYIIMGDEFEEIAKQYNDRFEPLYYSAYCYILSSWKISDAYEKKRVLEKAKSIIDRANSLSPDNDELLVLKAFCYQAMIMINPGKYGQTNSTKANELLLKAKMINKDNPRAEFLLAQNMYHRPVQYGGGIEKALPLFEKSAELFKKQKTNNYLLPIWGEYANSQMIIECKQ